MLHLNQLLFHFIPQNDGNIFGQIGDNLVGVDVLPFKALLATKAEELAGDICRVTGNLKNLFTVSVRGVLGAQRPLDCLGVADDRLQGVVELVGNPSGQLSKGFQFLRLLQPGRQRDPAHRSLR